MLSPWVHFYSSFIFTSSNKKNTYSGTKFSTQELTNLFYPQSGGRMTFKWPPGGQLRIKGWVMCELLANPDCYDSNGEQCLIIMKEGNTTDLTVGRYASLESYLCSKLSIKSIKLTIYNYNELSSLFSTKGNSGSLVFNGQGQMVSILHSGMLLGRTSHITYTFPAWWAIKVLKERYPYADFNHLEF